MRTALSSLLLTALFALPGQAQICKKSPPPFLADLFPETISGLPLQFSTVPGAGCMALYRPASEAARASTRWALVAMEVAPADVGETAQDVLTFLHTLGLVDILTVDGWPVGSAVTEVGDEFTTVRGAVRVKVLVKNGDHGDASRAMAVAFMRKLLAEVPCG